MFSHFRDPYGRSTGFMAGLACLVLAGVLAWALPGGWPLWGAAALAGLVLMLRWWGRRRAERYNLYRLFEDPPAGEDQPFEDTLGEDEIGAPYCGWCDEAYAPGVSRCFECGRDLG